MNSIVIPRVGTPVRLLVVALLALVSVVAAVLVAPPAKAQAADPAASDLLQVSKDGDSWSARPDDAVLAWSEPFEQMSPGDASTQQYYIRNVGSVSVRVDVAVLVQSLDEYSYLAGKSTVAEVEGDVTEITTRGGFHLVGQGAGTVDGLSATESLLNDSTVSGALLAPGSGVRVTNTVTFPAEVDRLPAEVKTRFMNQTTEAYFVPRASFGDEAATLSVTRSGDTPAVVGRAVDFTITGDPAAAVAGGTYVVVDADGEEIARVPAGGDGTAGFSHTFTEPGHHELTVRFEPTTGQGPVEPVTVQVTVTEAGGGEPDPGTPGGPGSTGSLGGSLGFLGDLGWLFAVPVVLATVALVVGGVWFLADQFRVPGVPPFPGLAPEHAGGGLLAGAFGGSSAPGSLPVGDDCREDDQREHCRDRGYQAAGQGTATSGSAAGPAPAGHTHATNAATEQIPLPVLGSAETPAADHRPWCAPLADGWQRLVDGVRGLFR